MKLHCLFLALAVALPPAAASADGDPVAGARTFKLCQACHTAAEEKNRVGPHLVGVVGRPAGTAEGYKYSKAMQDFAAAGNVWSEEHLAAFLAKPKDLVKGTTMAFAGIKKPEDIANVIAYLKDPAAAK